MRNLAAANLTQSQASKLMPLLFASLGFDEGTEYLHTGVGTLTWGGHDWQGVGDLGGIDPIEESDALSPYSLKASMSGLSSTLLTRAQNSSIYGRPLIVYIGFLVDGALVADPDLVWSGSMDTMTVKRGKENVIALTGESDLKFFDKANGLLFTDEEQQKLYSGDLGFEYLDQMQDAEIIWRGARVQFGNYPVPDGGWHNDSW